MIRKALVVAVLVPVWLIACVSEDDPQASQPPSCETYCGEVMQKCGGEKRQYTDASECMKACALLDLGTTADADVNSVGCRLRKARSATSLVDCVAAGPFGGGVCGSRCASFCRFVGRTCLATSSPPYGGSEATCSEVCPSFAFDASEGEGPDQAAFPGRNTLNCREYHVRFALSNGAEVHCAHADQTSAQCK